MDHQNHQVVHINYNVIWVVSNVEQYFYKILQIVESGYDYNILVHDLSILK